jgi:hypothetical protein
MVQIALRPRNQKKGQALQYVTGRPLRSQKFAATTRPSCGSLITRFGRSNPLQTRPFHKTVDNYDHELINEPLAGQSDTVIEHRILSLHLSPKRSRLGNRPYQSGNLVRPSIIEAIEISQSAGTAQDIGG